LDREGAVVDDLQPRHGVGGLRAAVLGVDLVVALDVAEEVGVALVVLQAGAVVPGVDEGLGGDLLAVAEGPAVLDRDREVLRVRGLDLLREHVLRLAGLRVVALQPPEDHVEHLAALHLVGVGGLERVLRVAPGGAQHGTGVAAAPAVAVPAPAGGRREGDHHRASDPFGVRGSAHGVPPRNYTVVRWSFTGQYRGKGCATHLCSACTGVTPAVCTYAGGLGAPPHTPEPGHPVTGCRVPDSGDRRGVRPRGPRSSPRRSGRPTRAPPGSPCP